MEAAVKITSMVIGAGVALAIYLVALFIWGWRRTRALAPETEEEFAIRYSSALQAHARRAALYLRLLDHIVVADPAGRGERRSIRQRFGSQLALPPAELHLSLEVQWQSSDSVEGWAEHCFREEVVHARQSLSGEQWLLRERFVPPYPHLARPHPDLAAQPLHQLPPNSDSEVKSQLPEDLEACAQQVEVETTCLQLDWRSDVRDVWPTSCDLVEACGVCFSPEELAAMSNAHEEGVGVFDFGGFTSVLTRRLHAAGYTLLSLEHGDGDRFLFIPSRDALAVLQLLRQIYSPDVTTPATLEDRNDRERHGGIRLVAEGESYLIAMKPLSEEEPMRLAEVARKQWRERWSWWEHLVFGFFCLIGMVIVVAVRVGGPILMDMFLSQEVQTDAGHIFVTLLLSALGLAILHNTLVTMLLAKFGPPALERRRRERGRPADLPLPRKLLELQAAFAR